jgi:hypothetical protein
MALFSSEPNPAHHILRLIEILGDRNMRGLGVCMLLAGMGVAAFLYLPAPGDRAKTETANPDFPGNGSAAVVAPAADVDPAAATRDTYPETAVVSRTEAFSPAIGLAAQSPPAVSPKLAPADPDARSKLVLDIQEQLRRVGCYRGRMDGSWGFATKDAMKRFTDAVNARLPLDQPDYARLALIQSQSDNSCGGCSAGQALAPTGRCVGPPVQARAGTPREVLPWKATTQTGTSAGKPMPEAAAPTEPLPEHMGVGGPMPAERGGQIAPSAAEPSAAATTPSTNTSGAAVPPAETRRATDSSHRRRLSSGARRGYGPQGLSLARRNLLQGLGGLY